MLELAKSPPFKRPEWDGEQGDSGPESWPVLSVDQAAAVLPYIERFWTIHATDGHAPYCLREWKLRSPGWVEYVMTVATGSRRRDLRALISLGSQESENVLGIPDIVETWL